MRASVRVPRPPDTTRPRAPAATPITFRLPRNFPAAWRNQFLVANSGSRRLKVTQSDPKWSTEGGSKWLKVAKSGSRSRTRAASCARNQEPRTRAVSCARNMVFRTRAASCARNQESRPPINPARRDPLAPALHRADTRAEKQSTHRASLTHQPRPVHRTMVRRREGKAHPNVMAGLVPAIHVFPPQEADGDARNKSGHDDVKDRLGRRESTRIHRHANVASGAGAFTTAVKCGASTSASRISA